MSLLDELERMEREATAGPWEAKGPRLVDADETALMWRPVTGNPADINLAAAARNALPALLRAARHVEEAHRAYDAWQKWAQQRGTGVSTATIQHGTALHQAFEDAMKAAWTALESEAAK